MIKLLKRFFGRAEEGRDEGDRPARTFKRILTGDYFGLRAADADPHEIQKAKQEKIAQIKALGLSPKFLRYIRQRNDDTFSEESIVAAHVVFQKEEYDEKLQMIHVTEISFIVSKEEFAEFEEMAEVRLKDDFKDLYEADKKYDGEERRKSPRPTPIDRLED